EVEVADGEIAFGAVEGCGAAAVDAAGEGVIGGVGDAECFPEVGSAQDREDGAKNLLLRDSGRGQHLGKNVRTDVPAFFSERAGIDGQGPPAFAFADFDVATDALE